jgi:hypothetical protein
MAQEFIATFNLEQPQRETANFTIQENDINVTFDIAQAGKDKYFVFEQAISNQTWDIIHNLNKKPSVTIVDEYDRVVVPDVQYIDDNHIIVSFNFAFKGWAYLN